MVPPLDAELIINGEITSVDMTPNTPTGCPTPAVLTLAMMDLIGMKPLMIAAGLDHEVTVPHIQFSEKAGGDPREGRAVPNAKELFEKGRWLGEYLSKPATSSFSANACREGRRPHSAFFALLAIRQKSAAAWWITQSASKRESQPKR